MRTQSLLAVALAIAGLSSSISAGTSAGTSAADGAQCAARSNELAFAAAAADPMGEGFSHPGYTLSGEKARDIAREMRDRHDWLTAEAAPLEKGAGLHVTLTRQDQYEIGEIACPECDQVEATERRLQVGVSKPIGLAVDFGQAPKSFRGAFARGGVTPSNDGGFAWTTTIRSPGAHALRVGFAGLDLPESAELYVYNGNGEAHGPYTGRGIDKSGTLVANMVTGDTATVQLRFYGTPSRADLARTRFTIADVGHIGGRFQLARTMNADLRVGEKAFCDYNASCVLNGECSAPWSAIGSVRGGVAHMLFQSGGGFYICSGGLLGNTQNTGRPLFLTANHCISRSSEASSLETFWDFRAASCTSFQTACTMSYATMRTTYPTALGATLLAHGTAGDYSLMELASLPTGRTFLGHTTTNVANNATALYRLSHPGGAPQAYSSQNSDPNSFTCQTLSRGPFIYSQDTAGATEGGSSGSPLLTSSGLVVGQLYGACGSNLNDVCDENKNRTVDGALASYYPNVAAYLDPSGGGGGGTVAHVASIVVTRASLNGNRTRGVAAVTVRDANNQPVAGATVSGSFSGFYSGTPSETTDASGVATLQSGPKKGSGTVSFCVTGVGGTNVTYDAGANAETCDTLN